MCAIHRLRRYESYQNCKHMLNLHSVDIRNHRVPDTQNVALCPSIELCLHAARSSLDLVLH